MQSLFGTVTGKRLAVLGFAFKADTNDTREAPAIRVCGDLLEEGAQLAIHDPKVDPMQIARDLKLEAAPAADALSGTGSWALAESVEEAVGGADAVLILTEWRQYRELNWVELAVACDDQPGCLMHVRLPIRSRSERLVSPLARR